MELVFVKFQRIPAYVCRQHSGPSEAVRHGGGRRTKILQGEREREKELREGRKERKKKEKEKRGEKGKKGREEQERRCIKPMRVKHPLRTVKK